MAKEGIFRVEYMPGESFRDYDLLFIEREEFDTLEEAREEARRRLGDLDDWRRSPPGFTWNGMKPGALLIKTARGSRSAIYHRKLTNALWARGRLSSSQPTMGPIARLRSPRPSTGPPRLWLDS